MARKDKPYLPLYVQDFMTDERLMECSAAATGVYIRLMCVMHKSNPYGTIVLQQKDKQNAQQIKNFAVKVARHFPYDLLTVESALTELLDQKVVQIEGDILLQKRMVDDGNLSETRSKSGKLGGETTSKNKKKDATAKSIAKHVANSDIEIDIEYSIVYTDYGFDDETQKFYAVLVPEMIELWKRVNPAYHFDNNVDSQACLQIAYRIAKIEKWKKAEVVSDKKNECLRKWDEIIKVIISDKWYAKLTLDSISGDKIWQKIMNTMSVSSHSNGSLSPLEQERQRQLKEFKSSKE